jgi:hypothetical protein
MKAKFNDVSLIFDDMSKNLNEENLSQELTEEDRQCIRKIYQILSSYETMISTNT